MRPKIASVARLMTAAVLATLLGCGEGPKTSKRERGNSNNVPASQEPGPGSGTLPPGPATTDCTEDATQYDLTYIEDILPVINKNCISCHYPSAAAGGWILDRYAISNPGNLDPVAAWKKVLSAVEDGRMPPSNPMPAADLATLKKWVEIGAPKQNTISCEKPDVDAAPSLLTCDDALKPSNKPRIWRLTHSQWGNSTRSILGANHSEELKFASDPALYGFDNFSEALRITILQTNRYRVATQNLAKTILDVARIKALRDTYSPGWSNATKAADRDRFIENFGFQLFRRPFTNDPDSVAQKALLVIVHVEGEKAASGYRLLIEAMLQSPNFLFRREIGADGHLNQYELAELLSFTIWDEAPDMTLLNLAARNQLTSSALNTQISRLLSSTKAERLYTRFFGSLLGIKKVGDVSKDAALFPTFDTTVAASMYEEFEKMIKYGVTTQASKLPAFFKEMPSYTNTKLAPFHGTTSASATLVPTNVEGRGSILTSLAFLTANAGAGDNNPFLRGKMIREKLLCMPLASPPANIPPLEDTPATGFKTRRERYAAHSSSPSCAGCHKMIDDLGFSFDGFNAVGKAQTVAGGLPVDTRGKLTAFFDGASSFDDAKQMSETLAESTHLAQCVSIQLFRYIKGRENTKTDGCQISEAVTTFEGKDKSMKELVKAILTNPDFFKVAE